MVKPKRMKKIELREKDIKGKLRLLDIVGMQKRERKLTFTIFLKKQMVGQPKMKKRQMKNYKKGNLIMYQRKLRRLMLNVQI